MNLYSLTAASTVRIECGAAHGTGFFVGEGLVLTCAHVLALHKGDNLRVVWPGSSSAPFLVTHVLRLPEVAGDETSGRYPYPDIALLRVDVRDNPSVLLGEKSPLPGSKLYAFGYPDDYKGGDSGYFDFEGPTGGPNLLFKIKGGQVRRGMSGAPLLDARMGRICGMLKGSRGVDTDLGGRAIPVSSILGHLPQLAQMQVEAHASGTPWVELRSATMLSSLPDLGASWSTVNEDQEQEQPKLALPSLEIINLAIQPVSAWEGQADAAYVESVRALIGPLVELDNLFGGQDLSRISARLFRGIQDRIAIGDYKPHIEHDILSAAAEVAEVAGWLSYDADNQKMARQLNQEALLMARMAGDRNLELLILQNMSMQSGYLNRPKEAFLLAKIASEEKPISPRLSAVFKVREGRALAQQGYAVDARSAFSQAQAFFSNGTRDGDPKWAWWFEEHELLWHRAMAEADLQNWAGSVDLFRRSIAPEATTSHRDRYVYKSHLLWALTEIEDWIGVGEVLEEISGFVGNVASVRTVSLLKRVERRLSQEADSVRRIRAAERLGGLLIESDDVTG